MQTQAFLGWHLGRKLTVVLLAVAWSCFAAGGAARADIVIDDFETGDVSFSDTTPGVGTEYLTQALPPANVVGGYRHLELYGYGVPTSMTLATTVGDDAMNLISPNTTTYMYIKYNANSFSGGTPALNLNLSSYDHFEISFSRVDRAMSFDIVLRSGNAFPKADVDVTSPGTTIVPFAAFGSVNWADVDSIRLDFYSSYVFGGSTHTESLSDFRVVPEPATMSLLALGLGALAIRRRRRS